VFFGIYTINVGRTDGCSVRSSQSTLTLEVKSKQDKCSRAFLALFGHRIGTRVLIFEVGFSQESFLHGIGYGENWFADLPLSFADHIADLTMLLLGYLSS
jgi:hypothetical protein